MSDPVIDQVKMCNFCEIKSNKLFGSKRLGL